MRSTEDIACLIALLDDTKLAKLLCLLELLEQRVQKSLHDPPLGGWEAVDPFRDQHRCPVRLGNLQLRISQA